MSPVPVMGQLWLSGIPVVLVVLVEVGHAPSATTRAAVHQAMGRACFRVG